MSRAGRYRVSSRTAGLRGWRPMAEDPAAAAELERRLVFFCGVYRCRLVSFQVLGDEVRAVVEFEKRRRLKRRQLRAAAARLFGKRLRAETRRWGRKEWRRFNRRLSDLSALMRDVKGTFAAWYNRRHRRRGPLWAERFKSTLLLGREAFWRAAARVELSGGTPPGAGPWGSARLRAAADDRRLAPAGDVFPLPSGPPRRRLLDLLLFLGTRPGDRPEPAFPAAVLRWARQTGRRRGELLEHDPSYADGLVLGTRRQVAAMAALLARRGLLPPGRQPIPCRDPGLWKLRHQRARVNDW